MATKATKQSTKGAPPPPTPARRSRGHSAGIPPTEKNQSSEPPRTPQEDYLDALKSIRDRLKSELSKCSSREVASIAKQLRETLAEIKEIETAESDSKKETRFYAIQKGRAERVAGTADQA